MAAVTYSMYKGERHCHTCLTHVPPFSGSATLLLVFLLFLSRVLHQYFICFQPLSVTLIMTRAKHCSQSPTGAHCPKCRKEGLYLCPSCLDSLAVYRLTRNFKAIKKKFHEFELKRDAAMHPGLIQDRVGSDLAATHAALQAKYDELHLELDDIEKTNTALRAKIMAKNEEKMELVNARKMRYMTCDGPRPPT